jgi:4-hydroxybenzoate polyprenyltransferase
MKRRGAFHALFATARAANIPSVVSNVWLGLAVLHLPEHGEFRGFPWSDAWLLMLAGVLLYVAGNFLNDWMDRGWDAMHRPERALPRGLFPPSGYLATAVLSAAAGVGMAAWVNRPAALIATAIVAAIIVYTVWHKKRAWTVIPMGLCRALLPVMGAVGISGNLDRVMETGMIAVAASIALFFHIVGLSLSARFESMKSGPAPGWNGSTCLFGIPPAILIVASAWVKNPWLLTGIIPYAVWVVFCHTRRGKGIGPFVSSLLAGIPLVDWMFLLPMGLADGDPMNATRMACLMIPPLAFVAGLLLQRLAPAT